MFVDFHAGETEVWIAGMPKHMIHLNGDKSWVLRWGVFIEIYVEE